MKVNFRENIKISLESIRSHLLRTTLTVLIIGFGITALVGILTSIDAIKYFFTKELSMMGANTFSINNRGLRVVIGGRRSKAKNNRIITWEETKKFKKEYKLDAWVSAYIDGTWTDLILISM